MRPEPAPASAFIQTRKRMRGGIISAHLRGRIPIRASNALYAGVNGDRNFPRRRRWVETGGTPPDSRLWSFINFGCDLRSAWLVRAGSNEPTTICMDRQGSCRACAASEFAVRAPARGNASVPVDVGSAHRRGVRRRLNRTRSPKKSVDVFPFFRDGRCRGWQTLRHAPENLTPGYVVGYRPHVICV